MALLDLFKRSPRAESATRTQRRSTGLTELDKATKGREGMSVLNLGPTSASNISYFTNLGHGIYSEDVVTTSTDPQYRYKDADGVEKFEVEKYLHDNMEFGGRQFDVAVCWDVFDYIDDSLLLPLAKRLNQVLKPGGYLLAFFHTQLGGPQSAYFRYHITGAETLDMQPGPAVAQKRMLNNRKIEELFKDFDNVKFMLARDNLREVLARR